MGVFAHFSEQLRWAGHIQMHDTSAPEASHKTNIKKCMDRVRKDDDAKTSESMIQWHLRVRTWGKIIREVQQGSCARVARTRKYKPGIINNQSKLLSPTCDVASLLTPTTFSPLRAGGDNLMSPDARVSYHEVTHSYMITHMILIIYEYSHDIDHI